MKDHYFEEQFHGGKAKLMVVLEAGEVNIRTHEAATAIIEGKTQDTEVTVSQKDNTVHVHATVNKQWLWHKLTQLIGGDTPHTRLTIHVPPHCEVQVKAQAGLVTIKDIMAPTTAHMTAGQMKLKNLGGPIYAKTMAGEIKYHGLLVDEKHRFEATTGHVRLDLTKEPNAQLDIRATLGHVQCDFPLVKERHQDHLIGRKIKGVLGSGAGQIKGRVTTGHLHMAQAN